ncbi:MAG: leucine-rich repeat domain-containing protein, partial [Clostridium sp.]|nr:leucine-rich repeat domain-containing protein [Clostridium sp.]
MNTLRKVNVLIMTAVLLLGMLAVPGAGGLNVHAETLTSGDYEYQVLDDGTVEITEYQGSAAVVQIPDTIGNRKVTRIGDSAFGSCSGLTGIEIPDSVTSIGDYAFSECSGLTSIEIPDSVTSIGEFAFSDCSGLTSIEIPDSVTSIERGTFSDCSGLISIEIPDSVTSIGNNAFSVCSNLTSIEIPDSVTRIEDYVFFLCSSLTGIEIPDSVTSIGNRAFYGCRSLTLFVEKDSYTEQYAKENNLPYKYIGESSTDNKTEESKQPTTEQTAVDNVHAETLTSGDYEFKVLDDGAVGIIRYKGIAAVAQIPDTIGNKKVTSIGNKAFWNCRGLTGIEIPDSVADIGYGAFLNCSSLTSIRVEENNQYYCSEEGVLFTKDKSELLCCPAGKKGQYIVSDSVTSIGDFAFSVCSSLTGIEMPDSVTSIGNFAFMLCSSLTGIEIPDSVTRIGSHAFYMCSGLTSIEIPDSVTSIENGVFDDCSRLTDIHVEENNQYYCSEEGVLLTKDKSELLCYPAGKKGQYIVSDSVTSIEDYAFSECSGLTSIEIPDSVTRIGWYAFSGCSSLTSIEIPDSVTDIWDYTFGGCSGLTSVKIPNRVTHIGWSAFSGCSGLTGIEIPDSVTRIGDFAFSDCSGLTSIEIPDSVTSIGDEAFSGCSSLITLLVEKDSYAEQYAKENNLPYKYIGESSTEDKTEESKQPATEQPAGDEEKVVVGNVTLVPVETQTKEKSVVDNKLKTKSGSKKVKKGTVLIGENGIYKVVDAKKKTVKYIG